MTDAPCCVRCDKQLEVDNQTCKIDPDSGQRFPCVRPDDQSVFEAPVGDGILKVKSGWGINRVPILDDPYKED